MEQTFGTLDLTLYTPEEQAVLILLDEPRERDEIIASLDTPPSQTLSVLTVLEIKGVIQERMGKIERLTKE